MPQKARVTLSSVNENVLEVLRRLEKTDSRIDNVQTTLGSRIDRVEHQLDKMDNRFESLEGRNNTIESELLILNDKFDRLETRVDRITAYVARIPVIEMRLDSIEASLNALEMRLANLEGLYEHHDKKLEILDHEYVALTAAVNRLEQHFDKVEADALRDRVRTLEEKVAALERNRLN